MENFQKKHANIISYSRNYSNPFQNNHTLSVDYENGSFTKVKSSALSSLLLGHHKYSVL